MSKDKIQFPGWTVNWGKIPSQEIILVAGGRAPSREWLEKMAQGRNVWGIDRGTRAILDASLLPVGVTGDFDSLPSPYVEKIQSLNIPIFSYPMDKDFTDLELALEKVLEKNPALEAIWLTGGFGGRLDHTLANLRVMSAICERKTLLAGMMDEKETLLFVRGGEEIRCSFQHFPKIISLLPLTEEITGAKLDGCYWNLPKERWSSCEMPPISNRLADGSNEMEFSLEAGLAGIYFCWDEAGL